MFYMRNLVLARKLGVMQIYTNTGDVFPVTLLLLSPNIIALSNKNNVSFNIISISTCSQKLKKLRAHLFPFFIKNDVFPKKFLTYSITSKKYSLNSGDRIGVDFFRRNQHIDITGTSIGKGFSGVIKRHGFKGLEATHGVSISHRSHGSTGQCQDPGKVFKGKKMAGQLGNRKVTIKNLRVLDIDYELGVLVINGVIPGFKNLYLRIKDSFNK